MSQDNEDGRTPTKRRNIENHDSQLVRMICIDLRSFGILEDNGFQEFIKNTSNYTLPTIQNFTDKLVAQYRNAESKLKKTLESIHHVAVTVDSWRWGMSSLHRGRRMLTITIHFVHEGKLVSRNLFTIDTTRQKNKSIANTVKDKLIGWRVFHKVMCFVNNDEEDECSIRKACTDWQNKLHVMCLIATLNKVMKTAFDFLHIDQLEAKHEKDNLEKSFSIKHGATTMTDRRLCWYNDYTVFKNVCDNNALEYDTDKRRELNECLQILKPFEDLNNTMSSQQFLPLSYIIPLFAGIKMRISECSPSTTMATEFKEKMEHTIGKLYKDYRYEPIAAKATFMDPRFKTTVLDQADEAKSLQKDVIQELDDTVDFCNPRDSVPSTSKNRAEDSKDLLGYVARQRQGRTAANSSRAKAAVAHYVHMPDLEQHEDPFKFWKMSYESYKDNEFYIMSQKYLCIPATAVPVESISGETPWMKDVPYFFNYNNRRNSLQDNYIDMILFLHSYYSNNNTDH